jgi:ubiquitin-protein ligase
MSAAAALRRNHDLELLSNLIERSQGSLSWKNSLAESGVAHRVLLVLRLPTSATAHYPHQIQTTCDLTIEFPQRYPFVAPIAKVTSPIWHPNVFPNGNVCLGTRWQASEGIDLFIARVARLLIFDPLLVNLQSVANHSAGNWYRDAAKNHPNAFPTIQAQANHWFRDPRGLNGPTERCVVNCPSCKATLRLPIGRTGTVQCPACRKDFEVST